MAGPVCCDQDYMCEFSDLSKTSLGDIQNWTEQGTLFK